MLLRGEWDGLSVAKYFVAVFDDELYGTVFSVHIGHFALKAVISHDGWCKDDCKILGGHLRSLSIFLLCI
jgi:hypothetical protein